jgi:hypothetical protein
MAIPASDREAILTAIEAWPVEDQIALAQIILRRSATRAAAGAKAPQRPSWRQMAGLASNGQTPPSDEEVAQWLDEHRSEEYGAVYHALPFATLLLDAHRASRL